MVFHLPVCTTQQLVKDMVIAFVGIDPYDSRLFQEVPIDECSSNLARSGQFNPDEFSEPGRIVIADGLSIAKSFKNWVCSENLLGKVRYLPSCRLCSWSIGRCDGGKVLDDLFRILCLAGTGLATSKR
jgi:hypothetical protein